MLATSVCGIFYIMKTGIYKITSPSGRIYIGQARDIEKRWKSYRRLDKSIRFQVKLYNSFQKYEVDSHKFEIIEECEFEKLNERERFWQDEFDVLNGGLNSILQSTEELPRVCSTETKAKLKIIFSGENNAMFGKKGEEHPAFGYRHSKEAIIKMSEKSKLHNNRPEELENKRIRMTGKNNSSYGKSPSKETRQKQRDKLLGKPNFKNRKKVEIDNVQYESLSEASKILKIGFSTIQYRICSKTFDNYKFITK